MPSSDDTIIISGPLKRFTAWIWNYKIMFGSKGINGLAFLAGTHAIVGVVAALLF